MTTAEKIRKPRQLSLVLQRLDHQNSTWIDLVFAAITGFIFLLIFHKAIGLIPSDWWSNRDDGIITLSHAKNLVDFGHIGVSPSGEKIEGFSAPLQFLLFVIAYFAAHCGYEAFISWQVAIATVFLGFFAFQIIRQFSGARVQALIWASIAGWVMTRSMTFLEWHYSGMENSITHAMYAWALYLAIKMTKDGRYPVWTGLVFAAAATSRFESIFHISAIVFLVFAFKLWRERNTATSIKSYPFALVFCCIWATYFITRTLYFGDLKPNTAYAQHISILRHFLDFSTIKIFFSSHNGYLLPVVALSCLWFFFGKKLESRLLLFPIAFIGLAVLHGFLFGTARLDPARTVSWLTPIITLLCSLYVVQLGQLKNLRIPINLAALLFLLPSIRSLFPNQAPYYLCCSGQGIQSIAENFKNLNTTHQIRRPTISISDLGGTSFLKDFNIIDTGYLGSDVLTKIGASDVRANYFFEIAAPDYVEFHSAWSCEHSYLFADSRWKEYYLPINEERNDWLLQNCAQATLARTGNWVRKTMLAGAQSPERIFHDKLKDNLSSEIVRSELKSCHDRDGTGCMYITRTVYRFLPEIRQKGALSQFIQPFSEEKDTRFKEYSLAWIQSAKNGHLSVAVNNFFAKRM